MNRMPCSISDDAYNDYSDFIENKGVYRNKSQPSPDDERDAMLDKQFTISLGIAPLTANRGSDWPIGPFRGAFLCLKVT